MEGMHFLHKLLAPWSVTLSSVLPSCPCAHACPSTELSLAMKHLGLSECPAAHLCPIWGFYKASCECRASSIHGACIADTGAEDGLVLGQGGRRPKGCSSSSMPGCEFTCGLGCTVYIVSRVGVMCCTNSCRTVLNSMVAAWPTIFCLLYKGNSMRILATRRFRGVGQGWSSSHAR